MVAFRRICLLLIVWTVVAGSLPVQAASGGLLAVIEAPDDGPARLVLRRDAGPEIRVATLPTPVSQLADDALAPDGRHLVYYTGTFAYELGKTSADVALHVWRIVDGKDAATIPLLPPNYPANIAENVRRMAAALPAADFIDEESLWPALASGIQVFAWSPDGTRLAYGSAQDGPSSDLYVYNTLDDTILRLTSGPEQINEVRWSPDGRLIWLNSIAYGLCQTCDGRKYMAVADGSGIRRLHGDEVDRFLGWVGPVSYVETDQANGPGDFDLRLVDLAKQTVTTLWPGIHENFVLDLATNRLLVRGHEGRQWQPEIAVYLVDLTTGAHRVLGDAATDPNVADLWPVLAQGPRALCEATGFFVRPCTERHFDPVAPGGRLRVGDNGGVYQTMDGSEYLPPDELLAGGAVFWQINGAGYFVRKGAELYHREIETGQRRLLHTDVARALWLPAADGAALPAAGVKADDFGPAPTPAAPVITPVITPITRGSTLVGSMREVARDLRVAQAGALADLALASAGTYGAWQTGLPLLLAREAVQTTDTPVWDLFAEPFVLPAAENALRTLVEQAAPWVGSFPRGGRQPEATSLAIHPEGTWLATGHADGTLRLWDPVTGTLGHTYAVAQDGLRQLAFSDSGRYVIAADGAGRSYLWDLQSGYKAATHYGRYSYTYALAWRPGSETWLIANGDEPVMGRGITGAPWVVDDRPGEALAFSPDGDRLAIALRPVVVPPSQPIRTPRTSEEALIVVIDPDTGEELLRLPDDGMTYLLAFSPDGSTLVSGTATNLRFWDAATGELRAEVAAAGLPSYWAFPNAEELAVLAYRSGLATVDLATGDVTHEAWLDTSTFAGLAVVPGTTTLFTTGGGRPVAVDAATGALAYPFDTPETLWTVASPTQPWVATASQRTVFVRDVTTQATVYELHDLPFYPTGLAFSLDGSRLVATEATGHVTVWEMGRGQLVWRSQVVDDELTAPAFAGDGRIVVSATETPRLLVLDGATGRVDLARPLAEAVWLVGVGATGRIATATYGGDVNIYDLENLTGDPIALGADVNRVEALAVNPAGDRLALAWLSGEVELWDIAVGELVATLELLHSEGAREATGALAFSADGSWLATGATSAAPVMLWDAATGAWLRNVTPISPLFGAQAVTFSAEGARLVVTDGTGASYILSLTPWRGLRTLQGHAGSIWDADVTPAGLVVTAGDDRTVRVWEWQTGVERARFPAQPERVYSVDVSPQGDRVAVAGFDGEARVYDLQGRPVAPALGVDEGWIETVVFSPDGGALAAATSHGAIWVWDSVRGDVRWQVDGLSRGTSALAYRPDGRRLAGASGGGADTRIHVWDPGTGAELATLAEHTGYVAALAYSPDGSLLASASWDQTIRLWDGASQAPVATLTGHTDVLTDLAFHPDGTLLASVAEDHTLRLWDVATGDEVDRIDLGPALPWSVAFTPDGGALITTHADGAVRTWLTDPEDDSVSALLGRAASLVPRATAQFTPQERKTYGLDAFVGAYPLSASGSVNLRGEPVVRSLIVRPGTPERLEALTDEGFLLASTDRGETWAILARLPLTLTVNSLAIPARADDPLLIATQQGLYRFEETDGSLHRVHDRPLEGVSYSHTNPAELWAVDGSAVLKSEDGGRTWGEAANDLAVNRLFGPLLMTSPNNNPQMVTGSGAAVPSVGVWRGAGNGFWKPLPGLPVLPLGMAAEPGLAWDAGNRTLYLGGGAGQLYAVTNVDAPDAEQVAATMVQDFGLAGRPAPLAVGAGPTLYLTLWSPYGPRLLAGTWDGQAWSWLELRLPIVAAG